MNVVIISGRLGRDPEIRYTQNNTAVCKFTLAVSRQLSKEQREHGGPDVDWIGITVFGRQAEICEKYLSQGSMVTVSGRIQTGSYKDKEGRTVYTTDVIANRVEFGSYKSDGQQSQGGNGNGGSKNYSTSPMPDDYPEEIQQGFEMIDEDEVPF